MNNAIEYYLPDQKSDKRMTHRPDYGMNNDRPMLPRDDVSVSDTSNKVNETGLIMRQPL